MEDIKKDLTEVKTRLDGIKISSAEDIQRDIQRYIQRDLTDIKTRLDGIRIPSVEDI